MGVARQGVQHVPDVLRHLAAPMELVNDLIDVALGRQVTREQEIHMSFDIRHLCARRLGQLGQHLRNGVAAEADAFLGVEIRDVRYQALHPAHAADELRHGHIRDLDFAVVLEQSGGPGAPCLDLLAKSVLEHHSPPGVFPRRSTTHANRHAHAGRWYP